MNAKSIRPFLAALLVVCAIVSLTGCDAQSSAQSQLKAQLWEYKVVHIEAYKRLGPNDDLNQLAMKTTDELNKLGADGWEYAGDLVGGLSYSVVFKRPRR